LEFTQFIHQTILNVISSYQNTFWKYFRSKPCKNFDRKNKLKVQPMT